MPNIVTYTTEAFIQQMLGGTELERKKFTFR